TSRSPSTSPPRAGTRRASGSSSRLHPTEGKRACRASGRPFALGAGFLLPGEGGLAGGLELVARGPGGEGRVLGDGVAGEEVEPGVLDHPVEVPGLGIEFVARLVVVLRFVLLLLLLAPARRAADEVGAGVQIDRRHADAREAELVGAVVVAAVGELVAQYLALLLGGEGGDHAVERGAAEPHVGEVAGPSQTVAAVDVDVGGDLPGGHGGVGGEVLGAEEALLLAPHEGDE